MKTVKKSLAMLTPAERSRGVLILVVVVFLALFESIGVASVMPFLAVLGSPNMVNTNPVLSLLFYYAQQFGIATLEEFLVLLGFGAFGLIVFLAVYRTLAQYFMNNYIEMLRHSIGSRLLETYLRQPYAFFLNRHSSELTKSILSEVDHVVGGVLRPLINMISNAQVLIAITLLLLLVDPLLAILAAGLLSILYTLIYLILKKKLSILGQEIVSSNTGRFMAATEAFGGIKDIKLLGREKSYLNRFESPSKKFATAQASSLTFTQVPKYMIEALAFGGIINIILFSMMSAGGLGNNALGQVLPIVGLYAFAAYRLQPAIQNIFQGFASLRHGEAVIDSIYADLCPDNLPAQLPISSPSPVKSEREIEFECLSYTYPQANRAALTNLNLKIAVGTSIGLVGSTGAGKTTLVDLLLGLLRPTEGAINIDGVPLTDENLRGWQQSIGYVPQNIFLTDNSISENIALGVPADQIDAANVEQCARLAQVHDFIINDLPAKYQTLVGERGVRLSGGQRQRIGIARALYHNPEVLVFDEATSALDTVTEQAVMKAIYSLKNQKTIIIIAHRLSTVKNCNQIVVLEQGAIRTKGTFSDLAENNTQFRGMALIN